MFEQFVKFLHLKSTAPVEIKLILQFLQSSNDILTSYMHRLNVTETETLPEMIECGPLCITDLSQNKSVAYF
jgi:hypothetical protein